MNLLQKAKALATDISQEALSTASHGIYHKIKMLENENNYQAYAPFSSLGNYFTKQENHVVMDRTLAAHVHFRYQNLIMDPPPEISAFDIIFCRNVMIYFDGAAKQKVLRKFYDALRPGGYLIIGFYDTMMALMDESMFQLAYPEAKIFKKV